jgi:hypothetical protein
MNISKFSRAPTKHSAGMWLAIPTVDDEDSLVNACVRVEILLKGQVSSREATCFLPNLYNATIRPGAGRAVPRCAALRCAPSRHSV